MQERHTEQDYRALLIADTPIIDVRAPIEFEQGNARRYQPAVNE